MYRPPENTNRVKSIKSKFENFESNKEVVSRKNGVGSDLKPQVLTRQISDPSRRNVKRTPAFRIDLNNEKSLFERNNACNRSFYFEKIHQFNSNKSCDSIKKNVQNEKENSKPVMIKSKSSLDFNSLRNKFDKVEEKTKNEEIDNIKNISCLYAQPKPKTPKVSNAQSDNTIGLTDTLKAALKRPLPTGPAPQKPPRTFEHSIIKDPQKNTSFLHKPPEKPKHDHRYMLSKLENAVRNNKIKLKKAIKLETSTTSGEDSDDSVLSKSKTLSKTLPNPSINAAHSFNFNCLNGLTSCRSTYETIKEPNSSFFVSCQPEPLYAEPFHFSQDVSKTEVLKNLKNEQKTAKSLYYMSTPLLCNNENNSCINMDENISRQDVKKEDDSSQSSVLSDLGSAASTPIDINESFETSVKHLIDTFETKQIPNVTKTDNQLPIDGSHRIEELRVSLQKTLEKSFNHDEGKSSVDTIINKFQTYVKTMPKYKIPKLSPDDRLFYCCLVVGWDREKPKIKFRYPPNVRIPDRIEDLCYPEAASGPLDISNNAQCYSLVITNDKGERTFGYCRRVIPEGSNKCIPLAYCILSKHRAPRFYKKILIELESRHGIPDKLRDELISKFYHNKFPKPGESVKIDLSHFLGEFYEVPHERRCREFSDLNETINDAAKELTLTLHHDTRYEEADLKPLHKLPSHILLKIFASLLLERKVILISCVISKLSSCVDALQSILYPFSWPHTYIPILPQCLWDVVESPTPVVCGILSVSVVNNHKIEHGIVVDLDECDIICEEGDEDNILSDSMKKAWHQAITLAKTISPDDYVHSVYLSDAYIKVFIVALKHYKNHIVNNTFEREAFIKSAKSKGVRRFLKWFTETTMFLTFIDTVINSPDSFNLFDKKIKMYGSDESNLILTKLREWKK